MKFANIIVDISLEKLDRTFQYRVPEELQGILKEGFRWSGAACGDAGAGMWESRSRPSGRYRKNKNTDKYV